MQINHQKTKEIVASRVAAVVSHLLFIIKSKAMKKQMKDPGCGSGCCTGAMVD